MAKVTRWTWEKLEDLHNRHENGTSQAQLGREERVCSQVIARLLHKFKRRIAGQWRRSTQVEPSREPVALRLCLVSYPPRAKPSPD